MSIDSLGARALNYQPCRYDASRLLFRGPRQDLTVPYIAFVGGTETYGRFVETPFVTQLNALVQPNCVNFGCLNAGVDVLLHDAFLPRAMKNAALSVLQIPNAYNLTNAFYKVHPRRNDRFVAATAELHGLYPEVDFAEFHFTKHLLTHLFERCPDRYQYLIAEAQSVWSARMSELLAPLSGRVVLLWLEECWPEDQSPVPDMPIRVSREMVDACRASAADLIEVILPDTLHRADMTGMVFDEMDAPVARQIMGPRGHVFVTEALLPVLRDLV